MKNTSKEDTSKKEELLQKEDTSNTQDKYDSKYERHIVDNTPFVIIEEPINKNASNFTVTMGSFRLSEQFENIEDAKNDAHREDWERIIQVIGIMIEADRQMQKINNIKVN